MSYQTLEYKLAGSISRKVGTDLKEWIEGNLLKRIHDTNCFHGGTKQSLPPDTGQASSLYKFEYTLAFKSLTMYRYFRRYFGPGFGREFRETWEYADLIEIYSITKEIDNTTRLGVQTA